METTYKYNTYVTYFLKNSNESGYTDSIHCNYINKFGFNSLLNQEVNIYFTDPNEFKFLTGVTGMDFNEIYLMVQIVENVLINTNPNLYEEIKPQSQLWKYFDVTNQIVGHVTGEPILPTELTSGVFKVALNDYNSSGLTYTLDYLNYPKNTEPDDLGFGDEELFLGTVDTDVEASVYTTDLSIILPLNEFNSSTNPTWNGEAEDNSVYMSEIGIYDEDKLLIGVGKFNKPLKKNNQISRTILFGLDF